MTTHSNFSQSFLYDFLRNFAFLFLEILTCNKRIHRVHSGLGACKVDIAVGWDTDMLDVCMALFASVGASRALHSSDSFD